jgi:hypothetical protein
LDSYRGIVGLVNLLFTAMVMLNERRDAVITGRLKDLELTPDHRQLIVYNDWLPTVIGIAAFFFMANVGIAALPIVFTNLAPNQIYIQGFAFICLLVGLIVGSNLTRAEYRLMTNCIKNARDAATSSASPSSASPGPAVAGVSSELEAAVPQARHF